MSSKLQSLVSQKGFVAVDGYVESLPCCIGFRDLECTVDAVKEWRGSVVGHRVYSGERSDLIVDKWDLGKM